MAPYSQPMSKLTQESITIRLKCKNDTRCLPLIQCDTLYSLLCFGLWFRVLGLLASFF